jgi:hypothetical protein
MGAVLHDAALSVGHDAGVPDGVITRRLRRPIPDPRAFYILAPGLVKNSSVLVDSV